MPITEQLLYETDKSSRRMCSIKKLLGKISEYSQDNTVVEVSFK